MPTGIYNRTMDKGTMICQRCGKSTPVRATNIKLQKYCVECSTITDLERKKVWARFHPLNSEQCKHKNRVVVIRKSKCRQKGFKISSMEKLGIDWITKSNVDLINIVRVKIPFTYSFSKNAIWSLARDGHVFLRKKANQARELLATAIIQASQGHKWKENKMWVDILVQKPNHMGDAVNVIDTVCDALKKATGIDDRWFCIRKLDWQIIKDNPSLIVGIGQEEDKDKRVCCYCGRILSLDNFTKNKNDRLGVGRECKDCLHKKSTTTR